MAISAIAFAVFSAPDVAEVPLEIAQHHHVEEPVVVQIDPGGAGRPSSADDPSFLGHVAERSFTVVVIQLISAVARNIKIVVTVVVVITDGDAHPISGAFETGFFGDVLKRAVRLLMIEPVRVRGPALLGNGSFGSRIAEGRAVHEKNV